MLSKRAKFTLSILLVILVLVSAVGFVACDGLRNAGKPGAQTGEKAITVIVGDESISASTTAEYMHQLLVELDTASKLQYEYTDGQYGATITKLNDLVTTPDWSKWIGVYHDINDVTLYDPQYDTTVNGKTYHSSSVGASSLPIKSGATYLFVQN